MINHLFVHIKVLSYNVVVHLLQSSLEFCHHDLDNPILFLRISWGIGHHNIVCVKHSVMQHFPKNIIFFCPTPCWESVTVFGKNFGNTPSLEWILCPFLSFYMWWGRDLPNLALPKKYNTTLALLWFHGACRLPNYRREVHFNVAQLLHILLDTHLSIWASSWLHMAFLGHPLQWSLKVLHKPFGEGSLYSQVPKLNPDGRCIRWVLRILRGIEL